jgi:hypothetical protein
MTPMSWVTSTMPEPRLAHQLGHQVENLGLHRHVQRGGRLVGDQQARPAGHGPGDHHPLAHAAAQFVRILAHPPGELRECAPAPASRGPAWPPPRPTGPGAAAAARRSARRSSHAGSGRSAGPGRSSSSSSRGCGSAARASAPAAPGPRTGPSRWRRPLPASRPMTVMKVWLLPEPLSPTTPRHSPAATDRDTPRTASTRPSWVWKLTFRSSTARTGWDTGTLGPEDTEPRP